MDVLFREAHTHHGWRDTPVSDETLRTLYERLRMAPTPTNSLPSDWCWGRWPGQLSGAR